ncbi:MAG TPA: oligosaccharide flippase family protein, partial [Gammaproteobacteria bacterium]
WHFSVFIVAQLLGAESALFQEMVAALRVAAVSLPVVLMSTILRGALEGVHDFKFVSTIKLILGSVLFGAPILAFPFGGTLAQVTAVIAVSRLFAALAYGLRLPGLLGIRLADCAVSGDTLASLLRYGGWLSVSYFVVPILAYVDRFFISNALGPAEVAFYGVPHEILLKSTVFPAAIVLVLFPTFVQRTAQSDHAALRDQYQAALSIIATVMHLFAIVCILTAAPLLRLWLGEEFAANSATVVQLVVIGCYASALMRVPLIHVQAAGYPHRPAVIHLIELPIYLFLVLPVAVRHGIDFVAAAWSARCLVDYWLLLSQSALISDGGVADRRVLFATAILQPGALILLMLALHLGGAPAIVALAFLLALGSVALTATPSDLHRLKRELSSLLRS